MPRRLRALVAVVLAVPAVASTRAAPATQPARPNVVLILADDLGSHDVGWRGSDVRTPNLDRLALGGARLEQFYVQPVCTPTRAALMTGRYPIRHGLQVGVVRPWAQYGLPLAERTLPAALREAGYQTAIVGKWHLGHSRPEYLPTRRGFDRQYGHYNGAIDYLTHVRDGGFDWHRDDRECRDEGYATHLIARESVRVIRERDRAKPLFLYVPFNGVHAPYQVPESYEQAYPNLDGKRRTYAAMVTALDEAVGQIVEAVRAEGLARTTLFVFSSDNGGPNPKRLTSNGALRGGKGTVYEGGVRTCAFAAWEGRIKPGTIVNAPLHAVDWYPTLLGLAGASIAQPLPLDGRDAWPAIVGGAASPHEEILINATPNGGAIRVGDWKLVLNDGAAAAAEGDAPPVAGRKQGAARVELFNLATDPAEAVNLAAEQPDRVHSLRARYDALVGEAVPPKAAAKGKNFTTPRVWGQAD